jgi:hypothetical protein
MAFSNLSDGVHRFRALLPASEADARSPATLKQT